MATKVHLRKKHISKNRQALYLEFYPAIKHPITDKPIRKEYLKMYVFDDNEMEVQIYLDAKNKEQKRFVEIKDKKNNPKKVKLNPIEILHNKETEMIAEQLRQKRQNEFNKPEIYSGYEKEQLKIKEKSEKNFVEYFKTLANKRKKNNYDNWASAYNYLETFTNGNLMFADLTIQFCNDFKEYLLTTKSNKSDKTPLSQNSAVSYFNKLKATLKQAYKDGYLQNDLNPKIEPIKQAETQRNFLTIEELNSLVKTECKNPLLKQAALFSALTGLRFSDIRNLIWSEIEYIQNNGYFIQFKQQKTKGVEVLPISSQAFILLGERKQPNDKVFTGLKYSAYENKHLADWLKLAGIDKKITFHCFRHTFATLQLSKGTDIYTVSKMLGHRDLKTTQIYAKIINATKREAADKIKLDF